MPRIRFHLWLVTCLLALGSAHGRPNVVLVITDDQGYGDLACHGNKVIKTPHTDKLASQSVSLDDYHVAPTCSPTRAALLTGHWTNRTGAWHTIMGRSMLRENEVTLGQLLKDNGYATGMFGKWHLGDTQGRFPTDQGFDEWFGIANTTDEAIYSSHPSYDPKVSVQPFILEAGRGGVPRELKPYNLETRALIDGEITEKSIDFMKRSVAAGKPFFVYVPFTHAHLPTLSHPDLPKTGNGSHADVLAEIDHRTGQILDAIDELKVRDNTIVLWLSDNGPEEIEGYHGTAGYWRGNYFTALEGSLRVPAMIRWPGKIPAGKVTNEIVHMVDVAPTLARATGAKIPADRIIDGVDQLGFLLGKQERSSREGFPAFNGDELFAYKWRNWKMHFIELESMFGKPAKLNMPHLHNLIQDPKELYPVDRVDVSASWVFPVVLKRVVEFQKSLIAEPPIRLGTPDPYVPKKN